jgi:hypothetical protein
MQTLTWNPYIELEDIHKMFTVDDPWVYLSFPVHVPPKKIYNFFICITDVRFFIFYVEITEGYLGKGAIGETRALWVLGIMGIWQFDLIYTLLLTGEPLGELLWIRK